MADSNITKKALAAALRELLEESSFEKVNVAQICERCGMNRKSFYYHFKDKYDLVNWIFDTDFIALVQKRPDDRWSFLEMLCFYFYENRNFYRKALKVKGQNSFSEHFREFLQPLLHDHLQKIIGKDDVHPMCIDFISDGFLCAIERWLMSSDCMPADQFIAILKSLTQSVSIEVCRNMNLSVSPNP